MPAFIARRLLRMAVTIWVIVSAVFLATRLSGNPIDSPMSEGLDAAFRQAMIAYWGLELPLPEQYARFWRCLFEGEFGLGFAELPAVTNFFAERLGRSAGPMFTTVSVTIAIGIHLSRLTAIWRTRRCSRSTSHTRAAPCAAASTGSRCPAISPYVLDFRARQIPLGAK
jgi:ABC-type dipeptide/oligopeptide/nickel transport system permease component